MTQHKLFKDRSFVFAAFFLITLFLFEEIQFAAYPTRTIRYAYLVGEYYTASIAFFLFLVDCLLIFLFVRESLRAKWAVKVVCFILFSLVVSLQYGYWKAFRRLMSGMDLYTLFRINSHELDTGLELFVNWQASLPLVLFLVVLIACKQKKRKGFLNPLLCIVALMVSGPLGDLLIENRNSGLSFSKFTQVVGTSIWSWGKHRERNVVTYQSAIKPDKNIVLIIDESIRASQLSINGYQRETTPYLNELEESGLLYNYGTASAGATCSPLSNALLLTGVPVRSLEAIEKSKFSPTIFQYAKAMNYKTHYIDAQTEHLWNGLTLTDMVFVDHWVKGSELGPYLYRDHRLAEMIRSLTRESRGNFVVVNKKGVHFLYEDCYPEAETRWKPIPSRQNYEEYPELVMNAYDNGVLFNVEKFFRLLIPKPSQELKHTVYVYTADHGQTLFEGGVPWLHCNYTINEASVPLFIVGNLPKSSQKEGRASHANIFPTILDLMNVPLDQRLRVYDPSLFALDEHNYKNRKFISGALRMINFDK